MPTHYKAQLTEAETPMTEILNRMSEGVAANARPILDLLGYYNTHDLPIPGQGVDLTEEEKRELEPIVRALAEAAITSVRMKDAVVMATLQRVKKNPHLLFDDQLPAAVQWELANDYQRDDEKPGKFGLDIWGNEEVISGYEFQRLTEANIKRASEAALARIKKRQTKGRPHNWANKIIAFETSKIFRSSGQPIARRRRPEMSGRKLVHVEAGPFYDFLNLVLTPLNRFLVEQQCPPVTTETVVRLVSEKFS
jgi:hypothetical protein